MTDCNPALRHWEEPEQVASCRTHEIPQSHTPNRRGSCKLPIGLYILASVIKSAIVLFVLLTAVAYTVWLERKVVGHMQNRWGPTRVGPFGLLQPAEDVVKFLFKEDLTPPHVYKPLYIAAPTIAVVFAVTSIDVIPFGNWLNVGKVNEPNQKPDEKI